MPEPLSHRTRLRLDAAFEAIVTLIRQFSGRLDDRTTPLPPPIRAEAAATLRAARRALSRDPAVAQVPMLREKGPLTPADLFFALLKAASALSGFARRHNIDL